jgi:hypothetical protein
MRLIRLIALTLGLSLLGLAGTASASEAGHPARARVAPSADAGYSVTGKQLTGVETWVTLPRAARFAREAGIVGPSIQLWTAHEVIDLRVAACTDKTCQAGGKAETRDYHAVLDVFNVRTHALICSTAARGASRCAGSATGGFGDAVRPGSRVMLSLSYPIPYDEIFVGGPGNQGFFYSQPANPAARPSLDFTQARIVAEFGSGPWSDPGLRAAVATVQVMSFDRPTPPPYAAEIWDYAGKAGGMAEPWWRYHKVATQAGRAYATAGLLWDDGYGLTVYLKG